MTNTTGHTTERREAILAAAHRVFSQSGYAAATMDAVAAEAGIAKGSLYNYFQSKADLFHQVFAHIADRAWADLDPLLARQATAAGKIEQLVDYWAKEFDSYQGFGRLVLEFWATAARGDEQGRLAASFQQLYGLSRDRVGGILAEGIRRGEFRPGLKTSVAASLILAILDGVRIQVLLGMGVQLDAEFVAGLKKAILAGLTAERGAGGLGASLT